MSMKKILGGFVGLVTLAIAATSMAAGGSSGGASPTPTVILPTPSPTIVVSPNVCPQGWHLQKGTKSGNAYTCIPTKTTKMVTCPPGTEYFDDGCMLGCQLPPPK